MVARRSARLRGTHTHQQSHGHRVSEKFAASVDNAARDLEELPNPTESPTETVTEFEQRRLEKVRANAMRLAELASLADDLVVPKRQKASNGSNQGVKKSRAVKKQSVPPSHRRTRAAGFDEQSQRYAAGLSSTQGGMVVLATPLATSAGAAQKEHGTQEPESDEPEAPIGKPQAAQSLNCDEDETKRYLHNLNDANKLFSSEKANPSRTSNHANIMNLSLREGNVSKVVKTAVVDLTFMPTAGNGPCVIAACDKQGQVGLWGTDPWNPDHTKDMGDSGILVMHPHDGFACALCWLDGNLLSTSYDGTVQQLDVAHATWTVLRRDRVDGFSAMTTQGRTSLLLAFNSGHLSLSDCRVATSPSPLQPMLLHGKRINTIDCAPQSQTHTFVTSSSDSSVKIWDARLMRPGSNKAPMLKPVAELHHTATCHGAYFDTGGSRVVTTSTDNTVRIWRSNGGGWEQATMWAHNTRTGRWVLPLRAKWAPDGDSVICGDMTRVDRTKGIVAAGTSSGRVHLWTGPADPKETVGDEPIKASSDHGCSVQ